MPRDGSATRTAILDAAERITFDRGFAGAQVERIIASAGVTKGGFFHHFASKQALADALITRWAETDAWHLEDKLARAQRLVQDPLEQLVVFVGLFVEEAEQSDPQSTGELPGCLFASYTYQAGLFTPGTLDVLSHAMLAWRSRLRTLLDDVVRLHHPARPVDLDAVADQVTVVFEGAYVVSRAVADPGVVAAQLRLLRTQILVLFATPAVVGFRSGGTDAIG